MVGLRPGTLCCVLAALAVATSTQAALPPVTMEDVVAYRQPVVHDLSFDGDALLADYSQAGQPSDLVRWGAKGRETLAPGTLPSASPDGHWLLYLADGDWVLRDRVDGSERRLATGGAPSAYFGVPAWSKDSRFVAVHYDLRTDAAAPPKPTLVGHVRVVVREGRPDPDSAQLGIHNPRLLIWDVSATAPQVTTIPVTASFTGSWSVRDGRPIYFYALGQHGFGGQTPFTAIQELDPQSNQSRELVRFPGFSQGGRPKLSPGGAALALAIDVDTPVFGVANSVVVVDLANGAWKRLTTARAVSELAWASDGWIYFTARSGGLQQLGRIDLDGREEPLSHDALDRRNLTISASGGVLAYTTTDGYGHTDVRRLALETRRETIVETLAAPEQRYQLGRFQAVRWPTPDGLSLHGFLVLPPAFDPKTRYPVFVDVHGSGPGASLALHSLFGWRGQTPLEWHAWANLGYIVFVPDYRSSGEYGSAVNLARVAAIDGDIDGIAQDARDVEAGVRWLISAPYVDPKRIALFGHSAGGGRVNYLLTRSSLFAAGIVHEPVPSGPDAQDLRLAELGLPASWSRAQIAPSEQRALGASFLFDGWRSKTPTLIMVGNPDKGAGDPLSAEMLYSMLLAAHVPTQFVRYADDGHVPNADESALHRFRGIKAWLDRYLAPASRPSP